MLKEFICLNKRAIISGLRVLILVIALISLIVCSILFSNGEIPGLFIYLMTIVGVSTGLPIFFTTIVYLRWSWDIKVNRRNIANFPFCDLGKIGFRKITLNQNSKWSFVKEIYRGEINGFIIDVDTDTQNYYKYLRFRFTLKPRPEDIVDFDLNSMSIDELKSGSGFSKVLTKYHYENHGLNSIQQLEKELMVLANNLNKKRN